MLKVKFLAAPAVGALLLLSAATASADGSTVPGASGNAQPVSASAGSASISTGRAGAGASGSSASGSHCGVSAAVAGTGYNAQPQQAGTNGTSTPNCSSGSTSNGGGITQGAPNPGGSSATGAGATDGTQAGSGSNSTGRSSILASLGSGESTANQSSARVGAWLWLLLALGAGLLIFFVGAVVGSRRRKEATETAAA